MGVKLYSGFFKKKKLYSTCISVTKFRIFLSAITEIIEIICEISAKFCRKFEPWIH